MSKRLPAALTLTSLMLFVLLGACRKNEFAVEFDLPEGVDQTYRVLYYASDPVKGWVVESVVSVEKGKALMQAPTHNPAIVYVFGNGREPATFFYAERGEKIAVTGGNNNPASWDFSGNKINEGLNAWRKTNRDLLLKRKAQDNAVVDSLNAAVVKYAKQHPEDPVSALLLLEYYDRGADEDGFRSAWALLKGEAVDGRWRELVSRADMLELPRAEKFPSEIVLKRAGGGLDTLTFGKRPALLRFSRANVPDYGTSTKQLRSLATESDSDSRIIANVLLEPDSMVRQQNRRRDSLANVVEAWVPLGVSDPVVSKLGVMRLPYVIVVDTTGKLLYRGSDLQKAIDLFKPQLKE